MLVATLSRPPVNALDDKLIAQLDAVVDRAIEDDGIAVLHLRSDQRVFSAGADLALIAACFATPQGPDAMTDVVREMQRLYWRLEAAPLVTLAEIDTLALGGGLELALACDLRVAALEARLGLPEARAGPAARRRRHAAPDAAVRPGPGQAADPRRRTHRRRARPSAWGWCSGPCRATQLADFARDVASRYAAMPKAALAANKRCIAAATDPARDGYADEIAETRTLYDHPDTRRKVSDFLAKRAH